MFQYVYKKDRDSKDHRAVTTPSSNSDFWSKSWPSTGMRVKSFPGTGPLPLATSICSSVTPESLGGTGLSRESTGIGLDPAVCPEAFSS